jgi:glycosyltransferase involved in cell wall biosynthesis
MENLPKDSLSVALAIYNGEKFLPQLLASLQEQTVKPLELVVMDDCSSDNSLNIIKAFPLPFEKKIFKSEKNEGPVSTFKKLAGLCEGDFIAFCDQDDIWLPEKLELALTAIKRIPNNIPAVVFSDLSVIDESGDVIQASYWKQRAVRPDKFLFHDILFANIITGCTTMINKAMANELSKMPTDVMMHDHWIALIGYSFGKYSFINQPTVLFRSHQNNVTNKNKITTWQVFKSDFKNGATYLQKNIKQAVEFKKLYAFKLNTKQIRVLNRFIDIERKPFFYKRFKRDIRSLTRRFR